VTTNITSRISALLIISLCTLACSRKIYPDRSQFLQDGETAPAVDLEAYRSVQLRPGQDSNLALAVSISGGGSRAANFGVGIMLGLEELSYGDGRNVLVEADYFSTVSGGGFAAGVYINALFEHHRQNANRPFRFERYLEGHARRALNRNYVNPLVAGMFNPRVWFSPLDDGDALEKKIDDHVLGYQMRKDRRNVQRSILLGDIFVPRDSLERPVRYPMHFSNSTTVKTINIFPFTPDILSRYCVDGYTHRMKIREFDELDPYQIPLAVGIKASGSFPVLISNSTLRSHYHEERQFLHLMDGAINDNFGIYTAASVLEQDDAPRRALIVIDAEATGNMYTFSEREGSVFSLKVLAGLTTSGLYARRAVLQEELEAYRQAAGIQPVICGFSALIEDNTALPPSTIDPEIEMPRLIRLLSVKAPELTERDRQTLYELLINIDTKYTIKKEEQDLLLLAGRYIVQLREEEIVAALGVNRR